MLETSWTGVNDETKRLENVSAGDFKRIFGRVAQNKLATDVDPLSNKPIFFQFGRRVFLIWNCSWRDIFELYQKKSKEGLIMNARFFGLCQMHKGMRLGVGIGGFWCKEGCWEEAHALVL